MNLATNSIKRNLKLEHVEQSIVEKAAQSQVVRPLLRVVEKSKQRTLALCGKELQTDER